MISLENNCYVFAAEGKFIILFFDFCVIKGENYIFLTKEDSQKAGLLQQAASAGGASAFPSSQSPVSFTSGCAIIAVTCITICLLNQLLESSYSTYFKRVMEDGENLW